MSKACAKPSIKPRGRSQTTFTRGGGRWSKKSTFYKLLYHRKCKRRGVGGQKKPNRVNVVCKRPLMQKISASM